MRHQIEHVTPHMADRLEVKFLMWDDIVERNVLERGTSREIAEAYSLLDDPSIYAYAFFRNQDGTRFKTFPYQDVLLNDKHNRIVFAAANQLGKSVCLCLIALTYVLNNPGKTVLMTSKTLPQSKDLLRQIKWFLNNSSLSWKYDVGDTDTKTEIYFRHYDFDNIDDPNSVRELSQSRIICVPATEAALGYAVDLALVDELAFYEDGDHFYKQILQPRTYATNGRIIVFSNPNGQQGIFWELWNDERFHHYRFNFFDRPGNDREKFNFLASGLTVEQVDSTLLAVFTTPFGGFLSASERKAMQSDRPNQLPQAISSPLFVFFDFAKVHDRTVRTVAQSFGTVEHPNIYVNEIKEYPSGTSYDDILGDLIALIDYAGIGNIAVVGWDNTGVGSGISDFIKRISEIGIQATPVEFSIQNKSRIYTIFKVLVERTLRGERCIDLPFVPESDKQFAALRFTRSSRGYLQVRHENESDRDDIPDSVAGVCSLVISPDNVPVSVDIVGEDFSISKISAIKRLRLTCPDCDYFFNPDDVSCPKCGTDREEMEL